MRIASSRFLGLFVSASLGVTACQQDGTGPSGSIGPEGGTVNTPDGVSITVPKGALLTGVAITIERSGETPAGALGPAFRFEPAGLSFQKPVQITLPYRPSANLPSDATERVFVTRVSGGGTIVGRVAAPGQVSTDTQSLSTFVAVKQISTPVAGQLDFPKGLAVNATHTYWTSGGVATQQAAGGVVMRAALDGGAPEVFASGQADPKHIALTSGYAYWTDGGSGPGVGDAGIMKAPLSGGAPTRIVPGSFPIDLAVNDQHVFWTDADLHTVNRANLDGSDAVVLAQTGDRPMVLALSTTHLYWLSSGARGGHTGAVMELPIDGGPSALALTLAMNQAEPSSLAVDATSVYWVNAGDGLVLSVPLGGGPATVLRHMSRPNAIAVDASSYYVGEVLPGLLVRYPKAGGTGDVRSSNEGHPNQLALDANNVYWVNDGASAYQGDVQVINKSP